MGMGFGWVRSGYLGKRERGREAGRLMMALMLRDGDVSGDWTG